MHSCEQVPVSSELSTVSSEVVKLAYLLGTNRSMSSTIVSGDSNADLEARPSEHATRSAQVPPSRIALSRNTPCSSWLMAESINRMVKIKGTVKRDRQQDLSCEYEQKEITLICLVYVIECYRMIKRIKERVKMRQTTSGEHDLLQTYREYSAGSGPLFRRRLHLSFSHSAIATDIYTIRTAPWVFLLPV